MRFLILFCAKNKINLPTESKNTYFDLKEHLFGHNKGSRKEINKGDQMGP